MVVGVARFRRGLIVGGLAALVALPALGGSAGAVAPPSPSGTTLPKEAFSLNVFGSGPVKGIAMVESGSPGRVRYAFQGLPATGELRAVASTKPCSQAHTGSAKVLGFSLSPSTPGSTAAGQFMVEISGVNAGYIRSMRIFRGSGTGDQRACSATSQWGAVSTAVVFENVHITNFLSKPGPRGLAMVGVAADGTLRVRAELLHKDRGAFRLIGSTKPCSEPHTGSARVFAADYELGDTGTHEVGHFLSATRTPAKPVDQLRSVRVVAKNDVATEEIQCRGIIAILIGL